MDFVSYNDIIIFWLVVGFRFVVPLFIPKYPLPAIVASLIIDAADQTIFQKYTNLDLSGYQGYDKALDIYYLTIAYLSVLRNWKNQYAVRIAKFLWYYRLVGITLFELTYSGVGPRWLLFIFPNVFEYFFIFYEAINLKWDTKKLSKRFLIYSAAFIWIFIKLPQEYWIHIAQLDTTDFLKENIFHVPLDASMSMIISENPWVIGVAIMVIVSLIILYKLLVKRIPKQDHNIIFKSEDINELLSGYEAKIFNRKKFFASLKTLVISNEFFEKTMLISLVLIIFIQMLELDIKSLNVILVVILILITNLAILLIGNHRPKLTQSMILTFLIMFVLNTLILTSYNILFSNENTLKDDLFFMALFTLISVMFDRYIIVYRNRFASDVN